MLHKHFRTSKCALGSFSQLVAQQRKDSVFTSPGVTSDHSERDGVEYQCGICELTFPDSSFLELHMTNSCPGIFVKQEHSTEDCSSEKLHLFQCGICQRNFRTEIELISHFQIMHSATISKTDFANFPDYICGKCNSVFDSGKGLAVHMKACFNGNISKLVLETFSCGICQKDFRNTDELESHIEIHTQSEYLCGQCGLSFRASSTLIKHVLEEHSRGNAMVVVNSPDLEIKDNGIEDVAADINGHAIEDVEPYVNWHDTDINDNGIDDVAPGINDNDSEDIEADINDHSIEAVVTHINDHVNEGDVEDDISNEDVKAADIYDINHGAVAPDINYQNDIEVINVDINDHSIEDVEADINDNVAAADIGDIDIEGAAADLQVVNTDINLSRNYEVVRENELRLISVEREVGKIVTDGCINKNKLLENSLVVKANAAVSNDIVIYPHLYRPSTILNSENQHTCVTSVMPTNSQGMSEHATGNKQAMQQYAIENRQRIPQIATWNFNTPMHPNIPSVRSNQRKTSEPSSSHVPTLKSHAISLTTSTSVITTGHLQDDITVHMTNNETISYAGIQAAETTCMQSSTSALSVVSQSTESSLIRRSASQLHNQLKTVGVDQSADSELPVVLMGMCINCGSYGQTKGSRFYCEVCKIVFENLCCSYCFRTNFQDQCELERHIRYCQTNYNKQAPCTLKQFRDNSVSKNTINTNSICPDTLDLPQCNKRQENSLIKALTGEKEKQFIHGGDKRICTQVDSACIGTSSSNTVNISESNNVLHGRANVMENKPMTPYEQAQLKIRHNEVIGLCVKESRPKDKCQGTLSCLNSEQEDDCTIVPDRLLQKYISHFQCHNCSSVYKISHHGYTCPYCRKQKHVRLNQLMCVCMQTCFTSVDSLDEHLSKCKQMKSSSDQQKVACLLVPRGVNSYKICVMEQEKLKNIASKALWLVPLNDSIMTTEICIKEKRVILKKKPKMLRANTRKKPKVTTVMVDNTTSDPRQTFSKFTSPELNITENKLVHADIENDNTSNSYKYAGIGDVQYVASLLPTVVSDPDTTNESISGVCHLENNSDGCYEYNSKGVTVSDEIPVSERQNENGGDEVVNSETCKEKMTHILNSGERKDKSERSEAKSVEGRSGDKPLELASPDTHVDKQAEESKSPAHSPLYADIGVQAENTLFSKVTSCNEDEVNIIESESEDSDGSGFEEIEMVEDNIIEESNSRNKSLDIRCCDDDIDINRNNMISHASSMIRFDRSNVKIMPCKVILERIHLSEVGQITGKNKRRKSAKYSEVCEETCVNNKKLSEMKTKCEHQSNGKANTIQSLLQKRKRMLIEIKKTNAAIAMEKTRGIMLVKPRTQCNERNKRIEVPKIPTCIATQQAKFNQKKRKRYMNLVDSNGDMVHSAKKRISVEMSDTKLNQMKSRVKVCTDSDASGDISSNVLSPAKSREDKRLKRTVLPGHKYDVTEQVHTRKAIVILDKVRGHKAVFSNEQIQVNKPVVVTGQAQERKVVGVTELQTSQAVVELEKVQALKAVGATKQRKARKIAGISEQLHAQKAVGLTEKLKACKAVRETKNKQSHITYGVHENIQSSKTVGVAEHETDCAKANTVYDRTNVGAGIETDNRYVNDDASKIDSNNDQMCAADEYFTCEICTVQLSSTNELEEHSKSHLNFDEYKCQECNKMFSTEDSLNKHVEYHKQNEKFLCGICQAQFAFPSNLEKHMMMEHFESIVAGQKQSETVVRIKSTEVQGSDGNPSRPLLSKLLAYKPKLP